MFPLFISMPSYVTLRTLTNVLHLYCILFKKHILRPMGHFEPQPYNSQIKPISCNSCYVRFDLNTITAQANATVVMCG